MSNILHVDPRMFQRMQESANTADSRGADPAIAALAPTGIDWRVLGGETKVVVDLDTPEDRPDGVCRLEQGD